MPDPATRFVLKRLNWAEHYDGMLERRPGERAVASFATFDEADAERTRREAEVRATVNPFTGGPAVHYWTHLDEPRLRDWLMDRGVDPPAAKKDGTADWSAWWKKQHKKLSDEQRYAVWEALDKVRFFAVREEPHRPVGYAVVAIDWRYNDENYTADADGGQVMTVFRTRAAAEADCSMSNDLAREHWSFVDEEFAEFADGEYAMPAFDMQERLRHRSGPGTPKLDKGEGQFRTTKGVPFYEVVEVSLEGLE